MKPTAKFSELDDDFPPEYTAQRRAGVTAAYAEELKRRAGQAGLLQSRIMQEKIRQAETAATEAAREHKQKCR
ncbi:MAG: hypothetical protein IKN81_00090 [Oscillospiraceae bacterium]|nr:hypothetical protein [Oscillospiraceae bacterium]